MWNNLSLGLLCILGCACLQRACLTHSWFFIKLDKVLFEVRSKFVEKVSSTVLKQLLDDLSEDRVLNEEEMESVIEEHKARTDKARCLIDMVRKKGPKASEKMIKRIQERDENLYDELGVASRTSE